MSPGDLAQGFAHGERGQIPWNLEEPMRSLTLRRTALAAVVPLALGTLAACGSGGSDSSTTAADPAAPSSSTSATTSSSDDSTSPGSKIASADFLELARAAAGKLSTVKVNMVGDVSGSQYTMNGAMDMTGDKPKMSLKMNMGAAGLTGEMRLVDGIMYMNLGSATQNKFVKFDLSDPNNPLGQLSTSLDQLDPSKMMSGMSPDVFKNVTFVGSDANGRHYRATLVTAKAPQVKGLPASATANLPKTMKYDTWLDDQGRFTKFLVQVPNFMKMSATYSGYGDPVSVTAPPASDIVAMPGTSSTG
jgi:hypothetical protein